MYSIAPPLLPPGVSGKVKPDSRTLIAQPKSMSRRNWRKAPEIITIDFPTDGPLGIGLKERGDGSGVFVSSISPRSPVAGRVPEFAQILSINGLSAEGMDKQTVVDVVKAAKQGGNLAVTFTADADVRI